VCLQPLSLPVEQNPLAAYRLHQAPKAKLRWLNLSREISPLPILAFDLTVLSPLGPHCSFPRDISPRREFGENSFAAYWVCTLPLITVVDQNLPSAYHPATGTCCTQAGSGTAKPFHRSSH